MEVGVHLAPVRAVAGRIIEVFNDGDGRSGPFADMAVVGQPDSKVDPRASTGRLHRTNSGGAGVAHDWVEVGPGAHQGPSGVPDAAPLRGCYFEGVANCRRVNVTQSSDFIGGQWATTVIGHGLHARERLRECHFPAPNTRYRPHRRAMP